VFSTVTPLPATPPLDSSDVRFIGKQTSELLAYLQWSEAQLQRKIAAGPIAGDFERALLADVRAALVNARAIGDTLAAMQ
jgi:hypothetical protein